MTNTQTAKEASVLENVSVRTRRRRTNNVPVQDDASASFVHDADVANIIRDQDPLEAAKSLHDSVNQTYFTLGGVLYEIDETKAYIRAGYADEDGFRAYVEAELGIRYHKARYLVRTYKTFSTLGFDRDRLVEIGWTKAREIARLDGKVPGVNFDDLVDYAREHTREELISHIKSEYPNSEDSGKNAFENFTFRLHRESAEVARKAINAAAEQVDDGSTNETRRKSQAFDLICTEWLGTIDGVGHINRSAKQAVFMLTSRFGADAVAERVHEELGTGVSSAPDDEFDPGQTETDTSS